MYFNYTWLLLFLTVCYYHVKYAFQSESTLYSCLNVKELFAWNRWDIWILSDCNVSGTHKHLVCKRKLNHLVKLAKQLSCVVSSCLYGAFDCIFLSWHVRSYHVIWSVWLNGWVFVYKLSGCGFESRCSHFNLGYFACLEQGVPWHSGNYRVRIHLETHTWHNKNIQSNAPYI